MRDDDLTHMTKALELARRGAGLVSPNPMVGAVLVNGGRVVGEGFHRYDLLKHAEGHALDAAGPLARGATLYCSLEPCCHHGRTPPCTDALLEAGIGRAVIAMLDPNPQVNGRGVEILRAAGVEVEVGLCGVEAARLGEIYLKYIQTGLPFVHVVAMLTNPSEGFWRPSEALLGDLSQYDAMLAGGLNPVSLVIRQAGMRRVRHAEFLVVEHDMNVGFADLLRRLADSRHSSLIAGPFAIYPYVIDYLGHADKVTVVAPDGEPGDIGARLCEAGAPAFEAVAARRSGDGDFIEVTLYPVQ